MMIEVVHVCRRLRWPVWAVLLVLVWLALGGATILLAARLSRPIELCLFKRLTGLACPTCGFTRGILCLLRGQPGQAWLHNPLLFSLLASFGAIVFMRLLFARSVRIHLARTECTLTWALAIMLFVANWVYVILYVG